MKKIVAVLFLVFLLHAAHSQTINGVVVCDTSNFTIIKVWGTHYERGFAYGCLAGVGLNDICENYLNPAIGSHLPTARQWIIDNQNFYIDQRFVDEAKGVIDGMNYLGINIFDLDYIDVLISNVFLDFSGFLGKLDFEVPGCSSLMTWGDATVGTDFEGKSVLSRHVDWTQNSSIIRNHVVVAHIPSESDEQPWVMIGFKGQISALSGVNSSGIGAFMHSLGEVSGVPVQNKAYEPIWFSLRRGLEMIDYNQDQKNDVNDIRSVLFENEWGYAMHSIISSIASSVNQADTLIALVAELASSAPYHTFRTNTYDDLIPNDNLYTANSPIARNNAHLYCSRYMNVVNNIGAGTLMDENENWRILRDYSNGGSSNMQFMQFIPDEMILKLSVTDLTHKAYQKDPVVIKLDSLFVIPHANIENWVDNSFDVNVFPNPSDGQIKISANNVVNDLEIVIVDMMGVIVEKRNFLNTNNSMEFDFSLSKGIYFIKVSNGRMTVVKKIVIV